MTRFLQKASEILNFIICYCQCNNAITGVTASRYSEFTVLQMRMTVTIYRGGIVLWERHSTFLRSSQLKSLHHAVQICGPLDASFTKWFLVYLHSVQGKNLYLMNCCCVNLMNFMQLKDSVIKFMTLGLLHQK